MAIALRGASSNAALTSTVSTLTETIPTGTVTGDVMIMSYCDWIGSLAAVNDPSGWTRIAGVVGSPSVTLIVWARIATGSNPNPGITLSSGGSARMTGGISSFSGVDATSLSTIQSGTLSTTNVTSGALGSPAMTTLDDGAMVIAVYSIAFSGNSGTVTPASGFSEAFESTNTGSQRYTNEQSYALQATHGSTGVITATSANARDSACMATIALKPLASASLVQSAGMVPI